MNEYPVRLHIERPAAFDRAHVFLRLALLIVIGWIGQPFGLLWLGVPVVAGILVAQRGGQRYLDEDGPAVIRVLSWLVALLAYLALLTDRLPSRDDETVQLEVDRSGSPTLGSALLRVVYVIPSLIALAILSFVGAIVWLLALVLVLVSGRYPESAWRFLCAIVHWEANVLAYLASLTDRYPPFALEAGSASSAEPSS